ncbi:MAG: beta-glucuronidase [Spirochaetaceae bacterium]|nr:MAG: beta-glucuronidase [Spirochaetaceae bacterium]
MSIPKPEHPRPQFQRSDWLTLNGAWTCRIMRNPFGATREVTLPSGERRPPAAVGPFEREIIVPFAPESPLSGIAYDDFIDTIDYHRSIDVPAAWVGRRVLLHFGAVDFHADVFVNGAWAGSHSGGSSPFTLDITRFAEAGKRSDLVVAVADYISAGNQGGGKQSHYAKSYGCFYTRTTGIWQTVWLEAVAEAGLADVQIMPDAQAAAFTFVPRYRRADARGTLTVTVTKDGSAVGAVTAPCRDGIPVSVTVPNPELWYPGKPALYDVRFDVAIDGSVIDSISSYAALREVTLRDGAFFINGKSVYMRLVLDQGFYPDGVWTAPDDAALKRDIELSMKAGFNGARLHQKVFEDRFHYWADRLGYITWSEWPSWGLDHNDYAAGRSFENEVREVVAYLRNHPSIIAWTPFNETREYRNPRSHYLNHTDAYRICKDVDPTRPVNDASGYIHHITDIYTVHTYKPSADELHAQLKPAGTGSAEKLDPFRNYPESDAPYAGEPYIVDEFGGIKWVGEISADANEGRKDDTQAWGYGGTPRTQAEFFGRLTGLIETLLGFEHVAGWCYTQLTDVEQEQNGVYFYDRSEKFDAELWRKQFSRRPGRFEM